MLSPDQRRRAVARLHLSGLRQVPQNQSSNGKRGEAGLPQPLAFSRCDLSRPKTIEA